MRNTVTCIDRKSDNQVQTIMQSRPDLEYGTIVAQSDHMAQILRIKTKAILKVAVSRCLDGIYEMPWEVK